VTCVRACGPEHSKEGIDFLNLKIVLGEQPAYFLL
jgi:hypothetical protein